MRDAPLRGPPLAPDRLRLLDAHERAWRRLRWAEGATVPLLVGWRPPCAVSGGVLVFRRPGAGAQVQELLCVRTPSRLRGVELRCWKVRLPAEARDVCVDAAQDVLVYICACAAFLTSLLRCGAHAFLLQRWEDMCAQALLEWRAPGRAARWYRAPGQLEALPGHNAPLRAARRHRVRPRVLHLDMELADRRARLGVCEWRLLPRRRPAPSVRSRNARQLATLQSPAFEFLDAEHIVFPGVTEHQLCVYHVRDFPPFRAPQPTPPSVRCGHVFLPPPSRKGAGPHALHFSTNTLSTCVPRPTDDADADDNAEGAPFYAEPGHRVLVVHRSTPAMRGGERGHEHTVLHVCVRALLRAATPARVPPAGQVAAPCAPRPARLLRAPAPPHFAPPGPDGALPLPLFGACGARAVGVRPAVHGGRLVLRVADFHGGRAARGHAAQAKDAGRAPGFFERAVPLPPAMQEVGGRGVESVLCEDAILFMRVRGGGSGLLLRLTWALAGCPRARCHRGRILVYFLRCILQEKRTCAAFVSVTQTLVRVPGRCIVLQCSIRV
ncbi:hypothetical protein BC834DRAFT_487989 [Gloeopeniophorella convolvens]|nr:hypothetical protein BC834DRAFT_487989 [Gloeopeniophorella convolvens]